MLRSRIYFPKDSNIYIMRIDDEAVYSPACVVCDVVVQSGMPAQSVYGMPSPLLALPITDRSGLPRQRGIEFEGFVLSNPFVFKLDQNITPDFPRPPII